VVFAVLAALVLGAAPAPVERTLSIPSGRVRTQFAFGVHAPAFRAVRVDVPHGAAIFVRAHDARRIAGVGVATRPFIGTCRRRGNVDRWETGVEGCPAPQGRWQALVVKRSRAPARIHVTFFFASRSG
jgi:hypothetical protein